MEEILLFFALKYQGDFQSILKALQAKEKVSQEERREAVAEVNSKYTTKRNILSTICIVLSWKFEYFKW